MNNPIPHTESDLVLPGVKAKPSGWPPTSPDPDSRTSSPGSQREARAPQPNHQIPSLHGFRGLPGQHPQLIGVAQTFAFIR